MLDVEQLCAFLSEASISFANGEPGKGQTMIKEAILLARATQPTASAAGEREDWQQQIDRAKENYWVFSPTTVENLIRAALASKPVAPPARELPHTDGGRNMFFEGRFDGESERDQKRRLRWADDMRAAFERHTGNGWFDKDWYAETGIWTAAWNAALIAATPPAQAVQDKKGGV